LANNSTVIVTGGGVMDTSIGFQQVGYLFIFRGAADVDQHPGCAGHCKFGAGAAPYSVVTALS
jgi:hypothetical protein